MHWQLYLLAFGHLHDVFGRSRYNLSTLLIQLIRWNINGSVLLCICKGYCYEGCWHCWDIHFTYTNIDTNLVVKPKIYVATLIIAGFDIVLWIYPILIHNWLFAKFSGYTVAMCRSFVMQSVIKILIKYHIKYQSLVYL